MKYFSLNKKAPQTAFSEAVINGIAPDKGLYFPEEIAAMPASFFQQINHLSDIEIAHQLIKQFVENEVSDQELYDILENVLNFTFPVIKLSDQLRTLELFHGPTLAFKDVGAGFMAQCLGLFLKDSDQEVTVLVATSGDTGGAVAHGFLNVPGINVVILYPKDKVSDIQERQLTTLGKNISALRVEGTFDDCQRMVKKAFLDKDITNHRQLTSANSINVARWLPQLFYYAFAYKQLKNESKELVFSVPSGNFGNICAGIVASKLGIPIKHFVASVNSNDTIPQYLKTKEYKPKTSVSTISNAMDVGDPSNFIRIQQLFEQDFEKLVQKFSSYSFTDEETMKAMKEIKNNFNYIADPHGAVGYLGLKKYSLNDKEIGIFLETAHPIKFLDTVEQTIDQKIDIPLKINEILLKDKQFKDIVSYDELKTYLMRK